MLELRQFFSYLLGLVMVAAIVSAGAFYTALQGIRHVPVEANVSAVRKEMKLATAEHAMEQRHEGPPVWIAPTPKYNYDPKLMIVKPRDERLKDAELKRKQEAANHFAKQQGVDKKSQQKVVHQRRDRHPVGQSSNAYAYQPETRPSVGLFSIFR
jgi:hypothetical protein